MNFKNNKTQTLLNGPEDSVNESIILGYLQ